MYRQNEIDVRDLRIKELEGITLDDEKLNLDDLEVRIKFLISLLEKWRGQLEKEAKDDAEKMRNLSPNNNPHQLLEYTDFTSDSNSIIEAIKDYYKKNINWESKGEIYMPSLL